MASGYHSLIISACWSRGARSEVPETLVPRVPEKFSMLKATPYSVTEVPRMGMSPVAVAAAWTAGVALAMIRSTFLETKEFAMVEQLAGSLAAFWRSYFQPSSPSLSFMASIKPWVAASSASWVTNWEMPTSKTFFSPEVSEEPEAAVEAAEVVKIDM